MHADFESILKPVNEDVDLTQGVAIRIELRLTLSKNTSHVVLRTG